MGQGGAAGGPGSQGLGALLPGAACRHSALLCAAAHLPAAGSLLSYQSLGGFCLAQPPTAFSAWAIQGSHVCVWIS